MSYGRRSRGPICCVPGIGPVVGPDVVSRIRALEPISGPARGEPRGQGRSFAEVLERHRRGLGFADPLPFPVHQRRPLPPLPDDGEPALPPELESHGTFFARLWTKLQARGPTR